MYKTETENRILEAAKKIFLLKGMAGSRMQEIAEEAGINKALLHYYFRTKEKLFMAVFKSIIKKIIPVIQETIDSNISISNKIKIFVEKYTKTFIDHPYIPFFIIQEINRNPDQLAEIMLSAGIYPDRIKQQIEKEIEDGKINLIDYKQLVVNLISLTLFPIVAKPMLLRILFNKNNREYHQFLKDRIEKVPAFIIKSIEKK